MSAFAVKNLGVGLICTRIFKVCNRLIYWWLWRKRRKFAPFLRVKGVQSMVKRFVKSSKRIFF